MSAANKNPRESRKLRLRATLTGVFLLVLLASWLWRHFTLPEEGPLTSGQQRIELPEWKVDRETGKNIQLAYRDLPATSGEADAPVLIMVHGSPMASEAFDKLIPELNEHCRLILPDMPGFGGSTRDVPDYSIRSHAHAVLDLMDALDIEQANLLGYSQGGGVVLNVAELAPERVESLTLLSAIGVQDYELTGDYTLNHGLYGMQLLVLTIAREVIPHFGALDQSMFNVRYARNFWDSDQRPLRGILEDYDGPMLIVQGDRDFFVPPSGAREHHRIVPQSELEILGGGHLLPFKKPHEVGERVKAFVQKVKAGAAKLRHDASPERLLQAASDQRVPRREAGGRTLAFYSALLVLGTQVAEDLTCISAGFLAARGVVPFWVGTVACIFGIFVGDMLLYLAGRIFGRRALRHAPIKWMLKERDLSSMEEWFQQRGPMLIVASRFMPGTRIPVFFGAGMLHMSTGKFALYFFLAAAAWTPCLVGLAWWMGDAFIGYFERFEKFAIVGLLGVVVLIMLVLHLLVPMFTWRGRRRLYGRWRRWVRWEYWPTWVFYPPVALYVFWLGLRYRHPALFTAVNPGMGNGSGFSGESKVEILDKLRGAGEAVATWTVLGVDTPLALKEAELRAFMAQDEVDFPLVLKPDVGERGSGVAIVHDWEQVRDYLQRCPDTVIAQRYVPGREYGIFYIRYPWEEKGRIFGITDKRFTSVTGDGKTPLEELILRDDRAVCMRAFFEQKHSDHLSDVVPAGETYVLAELGTHCRGSLFLDGSHLTTEPLRAWVQSVSDCYEGFYFGRYDVRVPSEEDLKAGKNLTVIELNGVSSEATWIYDPKHSALFGWRTLLEQWRIAFQIADWNRKHGARPDTCRATLRAIFSRGVREPFEA
ncbi:alpha/beta fold hydrolase [Ruficoccus sp. ZRK36]|uniref:alpha/beta fold hydrolase n=1 Tax=Ruficoccus sp. ZRK36 TaxID=2866311 RepID=UPI001C73893B|nr:alpha/beta fold hydrolase [Ruficoccus sp. ZRK36]QYY37343.1 alpha/beta fold hydrolase [Ruficoccus sp. ZRK36]